MSKEKIMYSEFDVLSGDVMERVRDLDDKRYWKKEAKKLEIEMADLKGKYFPVVGRDRIIQDKLYASEFGPLCSIYFGEDDDCSGCPLRDKNTQEDVVCCDSFDNFLDLLNDKSISDEKVWIALEDFVEYVHERCE